MKSQFHLLLPPTNIRNSCAAAPQHFGHFLLSTVHIHQVRLSLWLQRPPIPPTSLRRCKPHKKFLIKKLRRRPAKFELFFVFPFFTFCGLFGIDFGTENIKISCAVPGKGVKIALNQQSKRLTPSYFAIWNISNPRTPAPETHWPIDCLSEMSWAYFDQAKSHAKRFPKNAAKGFAPLLGNSVGFTNREILALATRHLISTIEEGEWRPEGSSVVLVVEPNLPRADRLALLEAMFLSNVTLAGIIEAPTAAAHVYALEKTYLFENSSKVVVFVDIGAFHTWAAVFRFTAEGKNPVGVDELAVAYNYSLGAHLMDKALAESMIAKFKQANGIGELSDKVVGQFYDEAKRVKELLTVNDDVDVRMEDVIDDKGLSCKVTRREFNEMISDVNGSLHELFADVVAKAGLTAADVDSIELLGGTTRVPFVQQSLMDVSGMNKLNRTMNSDEAMALGAGYVVASRSGSFVIKPLKIRTLTGVNVTLMFPDGHERLLFNETSATRDVTSVNVTLNDLAHRFALKCNGVEIAYFNVTQPADAKEDAHVTIFFNFDSLTLPTVLAAVYYNGTNKENLKVKFFFPEWRMTPDEFRQSHTFIYEMEKIMRDRATVQQVRNDYESYIYNLKERISYDQTFGTVTTEAERQQLLDAIQQHQDWLFGSESDHVPVSEISKRLADLKRLTENVETRADQFNKRTSAFGQLQKTLEVVRQAVNVEWPEQKPWLLTIPQGIRVSQKLNETEKWFAEKCIPQMSLPPTENPIARAEEMDDARIRLQELLNIANRASEPTKTPEPTPNPRRKRNPPRENAPIDVTGYDNDEL